MQSTVEQMALVQPIDLPLISMPIGERRVDARLSPAEGPASTPATLDQTR
jgi:hypothetical protein